VWGGIAASEAVPLKVSDIDSNRMVIRKQGTATQIVAEKCETRNTKARKVKVSAFILIQTLQ
jgi:hypothetical protein